MTWEYVVDRVQVRGENAEDLDTILLEKALNDSDRVQEGWELVSVAVGPTSFADDVGNKKVPVICIYKRQKT